MSAKIRFAVDEDFDERVVRGVARRNSAVDFLSVKEAGLRYAPDSEVLDWAARTERVLLSHDRNTMVGEAKLRINSGLGMKGLIIVPQGGRLGNHIEQIIDIFDYDNIGNWESRIEFFPR